MDRFEGVKDTFHQYGRFDVALYTSFKTIFTKAEPSKMGNWVLNLEGKSWISFSVRLTSVRGSFDQDKSFLRISFKDHICQDPTLQITLLMCLQIIQYTRRFCTHSRVICLQRDKEQIKIASNTSTRSLSALQSAF